MAAAFSSDESVTICKSVDVTKRKKTATCDLPSVYELQRCVNWINEKNVTSICLQFPDEMLDDSFGVVHILKQQTPSCEYYILGDTSYGSCCVDEVAAQHVNAEAIIHFGHACLSPTNRLPVLYIFDKQPIDQNAFCDEFLKVFVDKMSKVLIFYDVSFEHSINHITDKLIRIYPNLLISGRNTSSLAKTFPAIVVDINDVAKTEYVAVFIGSDGRTFQNIYLQCCECKFYIFDPQFNVLQEYSFNTSKFLMRRMYLVEKVKSARTVGILVGTLGVSKYLDAIERIKSLSRSKGKKSYIVAVGKPNVPKLANFPEIEVFIMLSCPENSFLDSKEYYQPIVTPYEFELACNPNKKWGTNYITDFSDLINGTDIVGEIKANEEVLSEPMANVSLVGKSYMQSSTYSLQNKDSENTIALKSESTVSNIFSTGSEYLGNRSWKGLEQNFGETDVEIAKQGRRGIPVSYEDEPHT